MMCMGCRNDYAQQSSTARDTLDFCSANCELTAKSSVGCEIEQVVCKEEPLGNRGYDLREAQAELRSSVSRAREESAL
jgi:hypothetical protein